MKKIFLSSFLFLSIFVSAQLGTFNYYRITNAGGTVTVPVSQFPNTIYVYCSSGVVLSNNYALNIASLPSAGTRAKLIMDLTNLDFNGHTVSLFGWNVTEGEAEKLQYYEYSVVKDHTGGTIGVYNFAPMLLDPANPQQLDGNSIIDGTLPISALDGAIPITDFDTLGRGRILEGAAAGAVTSYYFGTNAQIGVGNGNDYLSVPVTGDIGITNAGVTSITAGVIVNADVNASAAIAVSKLAALTASKPVSTSAGGVLTTSNYVIPAYGGTGQDFSASTGFETWSGGTASVGAITDVRGLDNLSFVTANQGLYYLYFPFAATATNINCRVTSVVAGTDAGTIDVANNSGTLMTGSALTAGQLTVAASAAFGTGYASTLLTNNNFTAGQSLHLVTAKVTSGGILHCDVTYTRLN